MYRRFITRAATVMTLSLLGAAVSLVSAQDAPPAPSAPASDAAAPRSVMLAPPVKAATAAAPKESPKTDADVQQLEGVTVEGKRDALSESDRRLKNLIGKLPCNGCDTKTKKIEEHRNFTERAAKFVAEQCCIPTRPPEETEANELDRQLTQQIITPKNNNP